MKHLIYAPLWLFIVLAYPPSKAFGQNPFSKRPARSFYSVAEQTTTHQIILSAYEDKMGNQLVHLSREQDGIARKVLVWGVSGQYWEIPVLQDTLRADSIGRPIQRVLFPAEESEKNIGVLLITADRVSISCSTGRAELEAMKEENLPSLKTSLESRGRIQSQENRFNPKWWLKYLTRRGNQFVTESIYIEEDRLKTDRVRVFAGSSKLSSVGVLRYFRDEYHQYTVIQLANGLKISIPDNMRLPAHLQNGDKKKFQARQHNPSEVEKSWINHPKSSQYSLRTPCEVATQSLALRSEKGNPVR